MTETEILRHKLNLEDSLLDDKGKEEFLNKTDNFHDVFSLRDEIGTCEGRTKESHSKRNG